MTFNELMIILVPIMSVGLGLYLRFKLDQQIYKDVEAGVETLFITNVKYYIPLIVCLLLGVLSTLYALDYFNMRVTDIWRTA